jgi:sugar (pentulose or hexulose) kinase
MSLFLAIDAGASFVKGALLDLERRSVEDVQSVPFPAFVPGLPPAFREVDPAAILESVRQVLAATVDSRPVSGVLLCGQMHGLIFLDRRRHRPLSNFISWQDERSLTPLPGSRTTPFDLLSRETDPETRQALGNELRPNLPVSAAVALKAAGHLPASGALACSLTDFLASSLCAAPPVTDITNAAATGWADIRRACWHRDFLRAIGLGRMQMPPIVPWGARAGYTSIGGRRIPCYAGVGDQQAALLGCRPAPTELSINIGTGSQVALTRRDATPGDYQLRPFFNGRYLRTITHIPAGRVLNAIVGLCCGVQSGAASQAVWPVLERAAAALPTTDLQVDLSLFSSALGQAGSIANLREHNCTPGHLFRASLQAMASNYFACAQRISPSRSWRRIVLSGGMARKLALLRKLIADTFACDCRMARDEETLRGLLHYGLQYA